MKHGLQPCYVIRYSGFLIDKGIQACVREAFPNVLRIKSKHSVQ